MGAIKDNPNNHFDPVSKRWRSSGASTPASSTGGAEADVRSDFSDDEVFQTWEPGSDIEMDQRDARRMADSIDDYSLDYEVEDSYPGCEGCEPDDGDAWDMCRCRTIESVTYDAESAAKHKDSNVSNIMRHVAVKMLHSVPSIDESLDRDDEIRETISSNSDLVKGFRDIDEDDFRFDIVGGYYGDEVESHPSAKMVADCVDALLSDETVGRMFSESYLDGHPLTVDGVTDFLEEGGKSVPEGASRVSLKYVSSGRVKMSDTDRLNEVTREHHQSRERKVSKRGLVAIVDSEGEVLDGYWRVTGTYLAPKAQLFTPPSQGLLVLEVS